MEQSAELAVENARLSDKKDQLDNENRVLSEKNIKLNESNGSLENRTSELTAEISSLTEKADKKKKKYEIIEKKTAQMEAKYKELSGADEIIEKDLRKYEEDDKWQLPEPEYYKYRSQELTYIEKAITPEKAQEIASREKAKEEQEKQLKIFKNRKSQQVAI